MTINELETRKAAIAEEIEQPNADLDALMAEARSINEQIAEIRKAADAKAEIRKIVAKTVKTADDKPEDVRSSKAYAEAFANYIKTGKDTECRSLLTTNVSGGVLPVPTVVEGYIHTAWEREDIMSLVRRTFVPGNLNIGFELSATGAVVHTEGAAAPTEETLTLGIVSMIPANIKKWITISDEAMAMGGEEFLRYVYDELTHQIAKKAADELIAKIVALPATATATSVSAATVETAPTIGAVASLIGNLADNATAPVVVMNKLTWATFKAAQYAGNYAVDPFEGLQVKFNNSLPAYSAADEGDVYMIVGDFGVGAQANFPTGETVNIVLDDVSLAERDLVKLVGKEYVALGVVSDRAFALAAKPEA